VDVRPRRGRRPDDDAPDAGRAFGRLLRAGPPERRGRGAASDSDSLTEGASAKRSHQARRTPAGRLLRPVRKVARADAFEVEILGAGEAEGAQLAIELRRIEP